MVIVAVVVTYNRKDLLQECLDALLNQSYPPSKIIVFNNNSTDGTEKIFEKGAKYNLDQIDLVNSCENLGGAGGFSQGVEIASKTNCEWIWIMDDDTIPEHTALEQLINSAELLEQEGESPSFLASYVYGMNDEPMNVPEICFDLSESGYPFWYKYLDKGIVSITQATFVSLLIPLKAVHKVGYPIADYFIWGDDEEYTRRLVKEYGPAFFCGTSKVLHKRYNVKRLSIRKEQDKDRIPMYKYFYRNELLNARKFDGVFWMLFKWISYFGLSFYCLFNPKIHYHFAKFIAVQKGIWMYISYSLKNRKN